MAELMHKSSPLSGRAGVAGGGVAIAERPLLGKVIVRGGISDAAFVDAVAEAAGTPLPTDPNTVSTGDGMSIYWLGPDEWQIVTDENAAAPLAAALTERLADVHAAVVDVTDYYVTIRATGTRARDVLVKGTPFDLHPTLFAAGQCTQTRLAHATVLIHAVDDTPTYDLQIRWSMAEYLLDWLEDAALEYL
jgi:sarcosine oxidase subunit gamma